MCEVDKVFAITIPQAFKRSAAFYLVDDLVVDNLAMFVEVLDNQAVGGVEVDALYADRDFLPPGGPDKACLNVIVYLDDVVFAEAV